MTAWVKQKSRFFAVWLLASHCSPVSSAVKFIGLRKTLGCEAPGVGAIAAPVGELLERERENPAGRIGPGQTLLRLEGLDVAEPAVLMTLQPHAAAARHLRYLVDWENDHLAVFADRRHQFAHGRRDGARFIGRRDVEHLLALARIGDALVLGHDESSPLLAGDDELAAALVAEHGDH